MEYLLSWTRKEKDWSKYAGATVVSPNVKELGGR